jgi:hypothetical protein
MDLKTCKTCKVKKELSSFYSTFDKRRNKSYVFAICRSCHKLQGDVWKKNNPGKAKEIQQRSRKKNGRKFYLTQFEKWKKDWPERARKRREWDNNSKRSRVELAEKLLVLQNGNCAICLEPFEQVGRYDVDHSHSNGLIRGLLCRKCNSGLHYFEDKEFIQKAVDYLANLPASAYPPVKY